MNSEKKIRHKFYIPIDGKLYETTKEIYEVYYSMERRERYLLERSSKHELSYDELMEAEYPINEKMVERSGNIEDEAISAILIEQMLSVLTLLSAQERWLLEQLYFIGKSEVELANESGVSRSTLQSRKYSVLKKIRKLIEDTYNS